MDRKRTWSAFLLPQSAPGLPCRCGSVRTASLNSCARSFDLGAAPAIAYVSAPGLPCRCGSARTARLHSRARPFDLGAAPAAVSNPRNPVGSSFSSVMALNRLYRCVTHMRLCRPIHSVTHMSAVLMCRLRGNIRADLVRFAALAIAYVSAPGLPCRCGFARTAGLHSSARSFDLGAAPPLHT